MSKFTSEKISRFYKKVGLSNAEFFDGKNPVNLFKILKIDPQVDEYGNRMKTPYEMIGVFPNFVNGVEKPIVFAIKNRVLGICRDYQIKELFYKNQKEKDDEKSIIQVLKEKYRTAIYSGDDMAAEACLDMLSNLSSDEAREFKDAFYNYTKYYKRMKKQILIDLFTHFFLEFIRTRSSLIKNGLIKKNKVYKAYKEKYQNYNQGQESAEVENASDNQQVSAPKFGIENIKKVVIETKDKEMISEFEVVDDDIKIKMNLENIERQNEKNQKQEDNSAEMKSTANQEPVKLQDSNLVEISDFDEGFLGTIKSFINKKRKLFRKTGNELVNKKVEKINENVPFVNTGNSQLKEREIEI